MGWALPPRISEVGAWGNLARCGRMGVPQSTCQAADRALGRKRHLVWPECRQTFLLDGALSFAVGRTGCPGLTDVSCVLDVSFVVGQLPNSLLGGLARACDCTAKKEWLRLV